LTTAGERVYRAAAINLDRSALSAEAHMEFLSKARVAIALFLTVSASISAQPKPASGASAAPQSSAAVGSQNLKHIDQAALQAMVDKTARELLIPGAVVLLRTPQGEFAITYGTTLLGAKIPPHADIYFRAASNTKTMTAAVTLQLAQESKLSLDDAVSKYVAGVPNGDKITLANLLEMRSGLNNYTDGPEISASMDDDPARVWTAAELLSIAFAHPPNAPPGTAYEYNNTNYLLLSLVAEKGRWQGAGTVDARPGVRAAAFAAHRIPPSRCEYPTGVLLARLPIRECLGRYDGHASLLARGPGGCPGRHPPAQGLHPREPFVCEGGWGCYLHGQRSCYLDRGTRLRPCAQCRISAPLARQLAT
jgi:hypothetical protein